MISNLEKYSDFIRTIMKKVSIVPIDLLIISLENAYPDTVTSDEYAMSILKAVQRNGYLLMSKSGWAMTKSAYRMHSNDKFGNGIDYKAPFRIGEKINVFSTDNSSIVKSLDIEDTVSFKLRKVIDCLWIVGDMLPESKDFITPLDFWDIAFVSEETGDDIPMTYELVSVPENMENAYAELMRNLPRINDSEMRDSIVRIVLMENSDHAFKIPNICVKHICELDENSSTGYRVVETRNDDVAWSFYDAQK